MTGFAPILLAIAMLAVIALGIGGVSALRRPADRTRGMLMLAVAAVVLGNVLIAAWPLRP